MKNKIPHCTQIRLLDLKCELHQILYCQTPWTISKFNKIIV